MGEHKQPKVEISNKHELLPITIGDMGTAIMAIEIAQLHIADDKGETALEVAHADRCLAALRELHEKFTHIRTVAIANNPQLVIARKLL